jgi:Ca2+-binding RTX toxin-like protein
MMTFIGPIKIFPFPSLGLIIDGTDGNDQLYGSSGDDEMHGHNGNDFLAGGAGDDLIFGDDGNDVLEGGTGNDTLHGGNGNDTLIGGPGADQLFGDAGFDTVSYAAASIGVIVDMTTGGVTNDAAGDTYNGIEQVIGTNFGDIINGDANGDVLRGGSGDDYLFGQAGNDEIHGQAGDDTIRGGAGDDFLAGGPGDDRLTGDDDGQVGSDTFVISPNTGLDTITDFQVGIDKGLLSSFDTSWGPTGRTPFGFDGELARAASVKTGTNNQELVHGQIDFSDHVVFDTTSHTLYKVDWVTYVDGDTLVITEYFNATPVAIFSNGADLHTSDFVIADPSSSTHLDASDGIVNATTSLTYTGAGGLLLY